MLAPEIIIKNAVVEGGGAERIEVSNPHITSEEEGVISTDSGLYTITLNFSVIDQYNDSGLGSWIKNKDIRNYTKFKIYYNLRDKKTLLLTDLITTDIQDYLVIDSNGNKRYEYPVSYKLPSFPKSTLNQTIKIEPFFDLRQYVLDQGLPNSGVVNEFGESKTIEVIKNREILNSPNIINNVIIEDVEKLQVNLSFVDSFEKNIVSIIETDTSKNKNISAYVTDLFISKNVDNTHSFLFGIDKNKIIQTKSELGNYVLAVTESPELQSIINNNVIIKNILVTKKQVKKVETFNKLENKNNDYISYENTNTVLFVLNDSNKTRISNNTAYDFYSFTDTSVDNDNSMFQYTLTVQLEDSFKESLIGLQTVLLNNITQLEQYYSQISIPFSNSKQVSTINPHIDNDVESAVNSNIFGYYDIKTNTFKNNAVSLVPSNLSQIATNFSILYFLISAINKNNFDTAFVYLNSTILISSLQKSLSVSTSSLTVIKKTIEIMKNFASTVEKVLDIQLVDLQPEQEGSQTIKIGTNSTQLIELTYTFNNVVENTYYNNFKQNKILIFEPSQETNNFPILRTSKLSSTNRTGELGEFYSPLLGANIHSLLGETTIIDDTISVDSKESRLLISYINNLMGFREQKDLTISNINAKENSNQIGFRSGVKGINYKTLIGDLLSKHGVEVVSYKEDRKPEENVTAGATMQMIIDPLLYSMTAPLDYPLERVGRLEQLQESSLKNESITRLLNFTLSKLNASDNDSFAKLDNETIDNLIMKFIPTYTIDYLDNFGENIKDYNWTNFNFTTFSSFPLNTNILCRLKPTYENKTLELKNVIDILEVPYMYFILVKDNVEYNSLLTVNVRNTTINNTISAQERFTNNQLQQTESTRNRLTSRQDRAKKKLRTK
jgi:hypothetical protein